MNDKLKAALAGRSPLVIGLDNLSHHGDQQFVTVLANMVRASVNLTDYGSIQADAFILSREQAVDLADRLTKMVGS